MKKLAIVITHPIQYYTPIFQLLAKQCNIKVFYTWGTSGNGKKIDPGFGKQVEWDIPLLEGYTYEFLNNTAKEPGSHHAKGIINPNIIDKINVFHPDAILLYGYMYKSHFKVMRHFKGKIPVWFRGDSTLLDNESKLKSHLKTIYLTWVYKHVDKVFYVGTNNKAYFKKFGLKEEQLFFAPHAIDNDRFSINKKEEVSLLRERLGLTDKDILILFAGKLEPKKDPEILLNAFNTLNNQSPNQISSQEKLHLLFVGNGILENQLKHKVKVENIKNVSFIEFQNQTQMPTVYSASDVLCLPSKGPGETWGLAINEAMACGKAIICTNKVGCFVDLVKNKVNGFVFEAGNLIELTKSLNQSKTIFQEMGHASKAIITRWTFEKQVDAFMKQFNS